MKFKNLTLFSILIATTASIMPMSPEQAKNQLSETKTYQIFDVLSDEDKKNLQGMHLKHGGYPFGSNCNIQDFEACLAEMGNDTQSVKKIAPVLQKLCTKLSSISNTKTIFPQCGIAVEDEVNNFNNRVAWHVDIPQEICKEQNRDSIKHLHLYKVLVNLQGTGTLFTELKSQQKPNFLNCFCKDDSGQNQDVVKSIQSMLKNNQQDQLEFGEAVIFDMKNAVHSRPETTKNRALMSFVYLGEQNNTTNS